MAPAGKPFCCSGGAEDSPPGLVKVEGGATSSSSQLGQGLLENTVAGHPPPGAAVFPSGRHVSGVRGGHFSSATYPGPFC